MKLKHSRDVTEVSGLSRQDFVELAASLSDKESAALRRATRHFLGESTRYVNFVEGLAKGRVTVKGLSFQQVEALGLLLAAADWDLRGGER